MTKSAIGKTYVRAKPVSPSEMFMSRMSEQYALVHNKRGKGRKTVQVDGQDVKVPYKVFSITIAKVAERVLDAHRDDYPIMTPAKAIDNWFKPVPAKSRELRLRVSLLEDPIWVAPACKGHWDKPKPDMPSNAELAENGLSISEKDMLRSKARAGHPISGLVSPYTLRDALYLYLVADEYTRGVAAEEAGRRWLVGNGYEPITRPGVVLQVAVDPGIGHNGGPQLEDVSVYNTLMRLRALALGSPDDPLIDQWVVRILANELSEGKLRAVDVAQREQQLLDIIFSARRQKRIAKLDEQIERRRDMARGGDPSSPTQSPLPSNPQPPELRAKKRDDEE